MSRLKLIVIGPVETGKTLISNIIADTAENYSTQYESTEGIRILEIETPFSARFASNSPVEVELWDCAGSSRYQPCWLVIQQDTDAVIFVYNPEIPDQLPELELMYDYFVTQNGLNDSRCLIFLNLRHDLDESAINLPSRFQRMSRKYINASSSPNTIKSEFFSFVEALSNEWRIAN